MRRNYTKEEIRFVKSRCVWRSYAEMLDLFNVRFRPITMSQLKGIYGKRGLTNGRDGGFKPGHVPAGSLPVGHELERQGYVYVKVTGSKWKPKHVLMWEKANGKIPKSHVVAFADGNRLNITPKNLFLVSRGELAVMNSLGLRSADAALTKAGAALAALKILTAARKREIKGGRK